MYLRLNQRRLIQAIRRLRPQVDPVETPTNGKPVNADAGCSNGENWAAIVTGLSGLATTVTAYVRGRLWRYNHAKRLEQRIKELEERDAATARRAEIEQIVRHMLKGGKLS